MDSHELILWADHPENHDPSGPWTTIYQTPDIINASAFARIGQHVGERPAVAARSDILRYEIIARFGGIYADLDVQLFQPINDLLAGVDLFVADEWGQAPGNYLFGARANHPTMWTVVRDLDRNVMDHAKAGTDWAILDVTGPRYLNSVLQRDKTCVIYPWPLFNPLPPRADWRQVKIWPETAFGNHHYEGTWYDQTKVTPPAAFLDGSGQ